MDLSDRQKRMALARRELYWFEMGRVLWHRDHLLQELQEAAVLLDTESEGEVDIWLAQPTPISRQVKLSSLLLQAQTRVPLMVSSPLCIHHSGVHSSCTLHLSIRSKCASLELTQEDG